MPQALLRIDDRSVIDRDAFRRIFPPAFGFPDFHGRDSNAWVDCMPGPDDPGAGMARLHVGHGQIPSWAIDHADAMKPRCPDILAAPLACAAFVNRQPIDPGRGAALAVGLDG